MYLQEIKGGMYYGERSRVRHERGREEVCKDELQGQDILLLQRHLPVRVREEFETVRKIVLFDEEIWVQLWEKLVRKN